MIQRQEIGARGEKEAEKFLKRLSYKIIERNARNRLGEIDLVCTYKKRAVFVEVKALVGKGEGFTPEDHFSFTKQKKLQLLARAYLNNKNKTDIDYQIDLVAVDLNEDLTLNDIRHYPAVVGA